jgi:hypothetical protein
MEWGITHVLFGIGIELIAISIGFLVYFIIASSAKNREYTQ